jgi:hypothetical protein
MAVNPAFQLDSGDDKVRNGRSLPYGGLIRVRLVRGPVRLVPHSHGCVLGQRRQLGRPGGEAFRCALTDVVYALP